MPEHDIAQDLRKQILEFLTDTGGLDTNTIEERTPLFTSGMLDSFLMVEVIAFLEQTTGRKFPAQDIHLDNFDTIAGMVSYTGSL